MRQTLDMKNPADRAKAQDALDTAESDFKKLQEDRAVIEKELIDAKKALEKEMDPQKKSILQIEYDKKSKAYADMFEDFHIQSTHFNNVRDTMYALLHSKKPKLKL